VRTAQGRPNGLAFSCRERAADASIKDTVFFVKPFFGGASG
jgi:hypothetical protein